MKTSDFFFALPKEQIAQHPAAKRDESRLLVLDRATGAIEHRRFRDVLGYLAPHDVLVANDTKVIPARLWGRKITGGKVEVLLHKRLDSHRWEAMVKPGAKVHIGQTILLQNVEAKVVEWGEAGKRVLQFSKPAEEWLEQAGQIPLPPYIERPPTEADRTAYQTVYAEKPGAVAAPTAGLHFTPALLQEIKLRGVSTHHVTLHVGMGTFRPVHTEKIKDHKVESEWADLPQETCEAIAQGRNHGGRIFGVGTTTVRTLEAFGREGTLKPSTGPIDLFIFPPFRFRIVDCLITNFHLPCSSLLSLVCAFGGYEFVMRAYETAVREKYRFYSYGDAMLVL